MERHVEMLLRGGQFKQIMEQELQAIRTKYKLKRIEVEILWCLAQDRQHNTAKEIQAYLYANKGHISQSMDRLCQEQLLQATTDRKDRRYVHYEPTERASELIEEIRNAWHRVSEALFEGITEEEKQVLACVAARMEKNMKKMLEKQH